MGVVIPQVVTEDRASGAQVIDGSLKFDKNKSQRLQFTPSVSGNRRTWTISYWYKNTNFGNTGRQFAAGTSDPDFFMLGYHSIGYIQCTEWNTNWFRTAARLKDTGWYHIVLAWDSTQSTNTERWKFYINGVRQSFWADSGTHLNYPSQNAEQSVNKAGVVHQIGSNTANSQYTDGHLAQWYFIDGQALDASYFGYTDALTGTWRPKKLTPTSKGGDWANANGDGINWSNITSATGGFSGSYPKENLYEGILTSANRADAASNDDPIVIDFSSIGGVDVISTISIWSGKSSVRYQINDSGSYTSYSDAVESWKDISFSGKLNNLKILHGAAGEAAGASAIRIDGVILRDNLDRWGQNGFYLPLDGSAPIGHDLSKPNPVNNGTVWSAGTLAGTIESVRPWQLGFNGDLSTFTRPTNNTMASIVFDTPISFSTKFEIKGTLDSGSLGSYEILDATDTWIDVTSSFGNITANPLDYPRVDLTSSITSPVKGIRFNGVSAAGQPRFTAVYVDNVILVDNRYGNGWTPINFGGSNTLEKATGALPILNTDASGKKGSLAIRDDVSPETPDAIKGVVAFDGSGDTLSVANSSDFDFGSGEFTVEAFFRTTNVSSQNGIVNVWGYSSDRRSWNLQLDNSTNGPVEFFVSTDGTSGTLTSLSGGSVSLNKWHHVAVVRTGNTLKLFLDGIEEASTSFSGTIYSNTTDPLYIGSVFGSTDYMVGQISNVRVIKGTALYTSDFSVPTVEFTNVTNTKLLCCQSNTQAGAAAVSPNLGGINDGTQWSFYGDNTNINSSYPWIKAFDGITDGTFNNGAGAADGAGYARWTPSGGITVSTQLRINTDNGTNSDVNVKFVGSSAVSYSSLTDGWNNISGTGTLEYIEFANSGSTWSYLCGVEVDGTVLLDPVTVRGDAYATRSEVSGSLVLALPLAGTSGDVSNLINKGSSTKAISVVGGSVASRVESNFYGGSWSFDATAEYLQTSATPFAFGSGDFTIEYWGYIDLDSISTSQHAISCWQDGGNLAFYVGTGGESGDFVSAGVIVGGTQYGVNGTSGGLGAMPLKKWTHIAICREGTNFKGYINGILYGSTAIGSGSVNTTPDYVRIGRHYSASQYRWQGYLQDVRFYKGVAKYTKNFIPASTNPDILPDTPSGIVYNPKLESVVPSSTYGGSLVFDGSGDYLRFSQSSDWAFGTGDFSIEYFVYPKYTAETIGFGGTRGPAGTASGWNIGMINQDANSGYIQMYSNGGIAPTSNYEKIPYEQWVHIVYTRSGSTIRAFVNGILYNTASNSQDWTLTDFSIGITGNGQAEPFLGHLSNIRIIKGSIPTSYQTTSTTAGTKIFNVPVSPLTTSSQGAVAADVKFLGCNSTTSITDFTVTPNTPTVNGQVSVSYFNPFSNDTNIDTVRGKPSGYATFNPLNNRSNTLSDGNMVATGGSASWESTLCSGVMTSGKWYVELTHRGRQSASDNDVQFGLFGLSNPENAYPLASGVDLASQSTGYVLVDGQANWYNNSSATSYGISWNTVGTVVGLRYNADIGKLGFIINGIDYGDISTTLSTTQEWVVGVSLRGTGAKCQINFGQKPFKFPPPEGFLPLNAANSRPSTVVARPDQYVGIATYQGSSSVNQTISATGTTLVNGNSNPPTFNPDLIWIVERFTDGAAKWIFDSVRGSNNFLQTNNANAEGTRTFTINNNGVSIPANDGSYNYDSTKHYVACCWKAGGSSNTFNVDGVGYASAAAAGLDGGSITPTGASVGTKQGFSIITYTGNATDGATVAHGLGKNPSFILTKNRDGGSSGAAGGWFSIYHPSLTNKHSYGFTTNDLEDSSWNNHGFINTVSSTTWTLKTGDYGGTAEVNNWWINASGIDYVSYIWAEIPGFSKFGSFIGNNSTDGPFVYTGFRPKWILHRPVATNNNWILFDTARDTYNPASASTRVNNTAVESSYSWGDILSDGFKVRSTDTNPSGGLVIYAAFAEAPEFNLYGGQANAR